MLMTRTAEDNTQTLHVAFELSEGKWKLAFAREAAAPPRIRTVAARDLAAVEQEITKAKARLGLSADCKVVSCYEAGRDGFWLHRWLMSRAVANVVVDPASIDVDRRQRRRKTDRIDALKLLAKLIRHACGERVWCVVRVPTESEEDARRLHRERERLVKERGQHQTRIRALLATQGVKVKRLDETVLDRRRPCDEAPLPAHLRAEMTRELERIKVVQQQLDQVNKAIKREAESDSAGAVVTRTLKSLLAIGMVGSQVLGYEFFAWRRFKNGRQVGALAGLTGTPHNSGGIEREQGISKAGNRRVRAVMTELAWGWLRYQPESALSRWYQRRFAEGSGRLRRIGIVALARKLLVALWRYVDQGVVPEGAVIRPA
jgi:transposase